MRFSKNLIVMKIRFSFYNLISVYTLCTLSYLGMLKKTSMESVVTYMKSSNMNSYTECYRFPE